jgi:vacuolar-type H+-ATPase subunit E/Vma4
VAESSIARRILEAAVRAADEALAAERGQQAEALRQGEAKIATDVAARRAAVEKRLRESFQQSVSAVRLAEANRVRTERRRALDEVIAGALTAARAPRAYRAWVERQLAEYARSGDEIVVSAAERGLFEKDLAPTLAKRGVTLSSETGSFQAGFVVARPGSGTRFNCTLDKAFAEAVRAAEVEVGRTLFGS